MGTATQSRAGRTRHGKLRDLALLALGFIAGVAALGSYATYRIWETGGRDERRPTDAIVVLGAAQYDGRPTAVLAARLDHAIALYKAGLAPHFVVTGGKQPGDRVTEAETERAYAIRRGVPASAILMENTGRTTLESMENVRDLFERHGLRSALFVSDRTHMLRLLAMAEDQGIEAYGSPTTTSPTETDDGLRFRATLHELGGLAVYFFMEQGTARADAQHAPLASSTPSPSTSPAPSPRGAVPSRPSAARSSAASSRASGAPRHDGERPSTRAALPPSSSEAARTHRHSPGSAHAATPAPEP